MVGGAERIWIRDIHVYRLLSFATLIALHGSVLAQGYGDNGRPWGRLPHVPGYSTSQQSAQPQRYNPWAGMREGDRLAPPEYRGEADENAPKYHEPDPKYRELPKKQESLPDPRAYASPWSEGRQLSPYGAGYAPMYPGAGAYWGQGFPPYNGAFGNGMYGYPWPGSGGGFATPWPW